MSSDEIKLMRNGRGRVLLAHIKQPPHPTPVFTVLTKPVINLF